jgi:hypothetical protein
MRALQASHQVHVLQKLYDSEINFTISGFWDCGFRWKLGDDMNGFLAEGWTNTFDQAVIEIARSAMKRFPNSAFARSHLQSANTP